MSSFRIQPDVGGASVPNKTISRDATGGVNGSPLLNQAWEATLTVRTDNNTGTLTMADAAHTLATSDVVDIFFAGGVQYKSTLGTVAGTSVPIDLGAGTNLPAAASTVYVCKRKSIDADCAFSTLGISLFAHCTKRYRVEFQKNDGTLIFGVNMAADEPFVWYSGMGYTNPITDVVGLIVASQTDLSNPVFSYGLAYTPET